MNEPPDRDDGDQDESEAVKKAEVHTDEAKDRHTSHWDADYMTTEQIEAAHREGQEKQQDDDKDSDHSDQ